MNDKLMQFNQEQLERIENSLRLSNCEKCNICNMWMDTSYIEEGGYCNKCREEIERKMYFDRLDIK